jgi:hypothetical protein
MPANARSRTPAAAVCAPSGSVTAIVIRSMPMISVAPVQRGKTPARMVATPKTMPEITMIAEWIVIHAPKRSVSAFQSLVWSTSAYTTVPVKKTNA